MAAEKSLAIVLRVIEFSETSCIVTLMTREFGKITAMAKGARRPKSPFEAAIDVLAVCRVVFLHKTNAMSLLTEAKLEHRFRSGERELKRLYLGYYIVELLKSLTDDGDPQPELFDYALNALLRLDSESLPSDRLNEFLLRFELGFLELVGHFPMLTRCVSCGREKTMLSKIDFALNAGGVLCQSCRRGQANIVSVSEEAFQWLLEVVGAQVGVDRENSDNWNVRDRIHEDRLRHRSWLENSNLDVWRSQSQAVIEPDADMERNDSRSDSNGRCLAEIRQLINQYLTHLIGSPPRLHRFLKNL